MEVSFVFPPLHPMDKQVVLQTIGHWVGSIARLILMPQGNTFAAGNFRPAELTWLIALTRSVPQSTRLECWEASKQTTKFTTWITEHSPWEPNSSFISQQIPAFYGHGTFITTFTKARHLSLLWAIPIQAKSPPFSWRSILLLFSLLYMCHPSGLVTLGFPTKNPARFSPFPIHATCSSHLILGDLKIRKKTEHEARAVA